MDFRWRTFKVGVDPCPSLPVPRLEIVWEEIEKDAEGFTLVAKYQLVRRHLLGHIEIHQLSYTRTTGTRDQLISINTGELKTPFRDGCHMGHDARELRLPAYVRSGETVQSVNPWSRPMRASPARQQDTRDDVSSVSGEGEAC